MGQNLFSVPPSEEKVGFVLFWMGFQVDDNNSVVFKAKCKHKRLYFPFPVIRCSELPRVEER